MEEGLIAPLALSLPNDFTLLLVPEIDALKNSVDNNRHGNFIFDVNLSREVDCTHCLMSNYGRTITMTPWSRSPK